MATLPGPATDEQVAVPICTRTVPSMEMHRSVAAEATPAVIATSRTVAANATAPRRLAVRRVRFMLRVSLVGQEHSRPRVGDQGWWGRMTPPVGCRTVAG